MDNKSFGQHLARACKEQGVSYSELARRLEIAQPRISQVVRSSSISEDLFRRAASALGMEVHVALVLKKKRTRKEAK